MAKLIQTSRKNTAGKPPVTKRKKIKTTSQSGIYHIEKITASQQIKKWSRKMKYLVTWKERDEHGKEQSTWVMEENLCSRAAEGMAMLFDCIYGLPEKGDPNEGKVTAEQYDALADIVFGRHPGEEGSKLLPGLETLYSTEEGEVAGEGEEEDGEEA